MGRVLRVNRGTIFGLSLGLLGIALGLYLEGGKVGQIMQPTAALIVFGGTMGAVLVQFPLKVVLEAGKQLRAVFAGEHDPAAQLIETLRGYSFQSFRNGIVALDAELESINDSFLKKAVMLAVDGASVSELRMQMELEMDIEAERDSEAPKVFEAAGGFSPTIGILGAVIGLIQVMQRLENISEVGQGIAVAFVATIYGVGLANLFLLPCAGRLRMMARRKQVLRELMLEGVVAIVERASPRLVEKRLTPYLVESVQSKGEKVAV